MGRLKVLFLIFAALVCSDAVPGVQKPEEPEPEPQRASTPGRLQVDQAIQNLNKSLRQDRPQRSRVQRPDWQKALTDATRLHSLAQQIHEQLEAGPHQIPAGLNKDLKEVEKLAKQVRQELLL